MPQCCMVPPMAPTASTDDPSADIRHGHALSTACTTAQCCMRCSISAARSYKSNMLGSSCTASAYSSLGRPVASHCYGLAAVPPARQTACNQAGPLENTITRQWGVQATHLAM